MLKIRRIQQVIFWWKNTKDNVQEKGGKTREDFFITHLRQYEGGNIDISQREGNKKKDS